MKDMKNMKIIHESVNKRANGRVHSLTPVFPLCSLVRQAKPDFSNDLKGNHRDNLVSIM